MTADGHIPVAIIGSGIVGICCGLMLRQAGVDGVLIDRDAPGQATSSGNAGVVSPWSVPMSLPGLWSKIPRWLASSSGPVAVSPAYLPKLTPWVVRFLREGQISRVNQITDAMFALNRDNVELLRQLLKNTDSEDLLAESFYVHAFRNPKHANIDAFEYALRRERGAELERISANELHQLEPAISSEFRAAILIKRQARVLSPGRLCKVLMEQFLRFGGRFVRREVSALRPCENGGWALSGNGEKLVARRVVIAAGAWSNRLLHPLGLSVPMEAERGYHLEYPEPGVFLTHSVMDMDFKLVASSMEDGLRVAGTAEFAGLDAPPNDQRIRSLNRSVRAMLPDLNTDNNRSWMGVRPSIPDSLPCIGEFPGRDGLFAAFGHAHYGLMMAPRTGQIVADLVQSRETDIDLSPYRPNRFHKRRTPS